MYLPVETQPTCARAWLAAAELVNGRHGHEAQNVIIDIANPATEADVDRSIVAEVDALLRKHKRNPVKAVANTIFPKWTYDRHGAPAFYDVYMKTVFPKLKTSSADWGRYFERCISFPIEKNGRRLNPLRDIVDKMTRQLKSERTFKNVYELTVYDPVRDSGPIRNRQCLSFLSFKLSDAPMRSVRLTAMYRNHYYIERLLGNLVGLGHMMQFVATETGVAVGPLTVVSTHAEVDALGSRPAVNKLLSACRRVVNATVEAPAEHTETGEEE